ncbi:MAG: tRNA lysidine(34) synthetase TilS [Clostridia bacterium]
MSNVIDTVKKTIDKYNMLSPGDGVLVGVSGGPDSVCLLHILNTLKDEYDIKLYVAHVNHQLRGSMADQDAAYVEKLCADLSIPFFLKTEDVKKISKERGISEEAAGREVRYAFFFQAARQVGARKIAVAHNMNDQAETIVMRFIRGAGLEGLSGIKPFREDGVIRPLLELERKAIEEYCFTHSLNPRLDKSNLDTVYTRNRLRWDLIPRIVENHNPNFIHTAVKNAELIRQDSQFIEEYVNELLYKNIENDDRQVSIPIVLIMNQHPSVQRRIIRKAIHVFKGNTTDIEYKHIEEILQLIRNSAERTGAGKALDLPGNIRMELIYDKVCFVDKEDPNENKSYSYLLEQGDTVFVKEAGMLVTARIVDKNEFKGIESNKYAKAFDYNKLNEEIYIRNRSLGDKFNPLGMTGTKKLKDFFIDLKVPKHQRDIVPLVVSGQDIIWVVGFRMSDKYKCTPGTKEILMIEFQEV